MTGNLLRSTLLSKALMASTLTAALLLPATQLQATTATDKVPAKEQKAEGLRELDWSELSPPVDEKVVKEFEEGKITYADAMRYMSKLGNTPVQALDKNKVRIPGYLVPLNMDKNQMATELLLVPTLGACVHVPPPPPNQTIFIRFDKGIKVTEAGYTPYWLEGTLKVENNTSEYTDTLYGMTADAITEYTFE
ncbi:DUF3299 domain-containing protein [Parendozoicomonas haliclonae]|uniref:DUF3299 domain-containing protein n=1 Tax=Parendozoicomonas haliclonae TaxID=1960125 RepID=A0A1X7AIJ4_9GAMM|nr:DUF3299 domain-containing protein [Parendozoicomonas haliclonae]SMA43736.1 hypothetical protein EHSB41UT_01653 [Parendozoicomonas haliclonae]